jgi:hypothetical protein
MMVCHDLFTSLTISAKNNVLSGKLVNEENEQFDISDLNYKDGILSFNLEIPELGENPLKAWLKVENTVFDGALGGDDEGMAIDFPMKGQKK